MVIGFEASASSALPVPELSVDAEADLSAAGADASFDAELLPHPPSVEITIAALKSKASFFDLIINPPFAVSIGFPWVSYNPFI